MAKAILDRTAALLGLLLLSPLFLVLGFLVWRHDRHSALYIADRESHFHPRAYNAWSGAMGVYQHLRRYWPGRAFAYGFRGWSGFNARANIIVTMRLVRRLGNWSPWGI